MESRYEWVHELVRSEEEIEETGLIEHGSRLDPERTMISATLFFLSQLRMEFTQTLNVFNELKLTTASKVRLYNIAKTHADFMLFRNGFKLIFSLKQPGVISIRTQFMNPALPSVATLNFAEGPLNNLASPQYRGEEELLELMWGPFNETIWTYKGQPIKIESVVKYYLTKFVHDTTNSGVS